MQYVCLLLLVSLASSTVVEFSKYMAIQGYKCDGLVFDLKNVTSKQRCAVICSEVPYCTGFAYLHPRCVGCDTTTSVNATSSWIYKLDVCYQKTLVVRGLKIGIFMDKKFQPDAEVSCKQKNGRLVKMDEVWKVNYISSTLEGCPRYATETNYWVDGAHIDNQPKTAWTFLDGTSMSLDNQFWNPNGSSTVQTSNITCIKLERQLSSGVYRWSGNKCMDTFAFICEF